MRVYLLDGATELAVSASLHLCFFHLWNFSSRPAGFLGKLEVSNFMHKELFLTSVASDDYGIVIGYR